MIKNHKTLKTPQRVVLTQYYVVIQQNLKYIKQKKTSRDKINLILYSIWYLKGAKMSKITLFIGALTQFTRETIYGNFQI